MDGQNSPVALNYQEAIKTLKTFPRRSLSKTEARENIENMRNFLTRIGITDEDINSLNIIHVSGTKGKGSTCAYCESILRHHGYKTGFCSSPHLVEARERIRVNGFPLDMETFAKYFWEVYNKLDQTKEDNDGLMPRYFPFMVAMSLRVFLEEKVDVAVMEVGIGGEYDSTNVIEHPIVCGVTSLGFDHMNILGDTIEEIAWHKSGIFKPGVHAFTVPQYRKAMNVLMQRAAEKGCPLSLCPDLSCYEPKPKLGIQGAVQNKNASLALQLCQTWISKHKDHSSPLEDPVEGNDIFCLDQPPPMASPIKLNDYYRHGLEKCNWPGRNQKVSTPGISFYLDGAHTKESAQLCAEWFQMESQVEAIELGLPIYKILIFNLTGERDPEVLLEPIQEFGFDAALFCPNDAYEDTDQTDLPDTQEQKEQKAQTCIENKEAWKRLTRAVAMECHVLSSVSACFDWFSGVRERGAGDGEKQNHIQILVFGSVYLVGATLRLLRDKGHTEVLRI